MLTKICIEILKQSCKFLAKQRNHRASPSSVVKNTPANAGDMGSIPESGRSPGEGSGNPLQHSCLGNPMDKGTGGQPLVKE